MVAKNLRNLLGFAGVLIIFIVILTVPKLIELSAPQVCTINGECQHEKQVNFLTALIPVFIGGGAILGAVALYLFYEKTQQPSQKEYDASLALSLMERHEATIVRRIVEEGGRVTQSEVSRIEGIGKVRAHRILEKLEKRGVLIKERYGKTNMIKLNEQYRKMFIG